jgi:hypothetical protein
MDGYARSLTVNEGGTAEAKTFVLYRMKVFFSLDRHLPLTV